MGEIPNPMFVPQFDVRLILIGQKGSARHDSPKMNLSSQNYYQSDRGSHHFSSKCILISTPFFRNYYSKEASCIPRIRHSDYMKYSIFYIEPIVCLHLTATNECAPTVSTPQDIFCLLNKVIYS